MSKTMKTLFTVAAVSSMFSIGASAQITGGAAATNTGALNTARQMIPGVNVSARMLTTERLACGPVSGNPIQWFNGAGGSRTVLRLSFAKPATGAPIGSWTMRIVSPETMTPERTEFFSYDGTFTSGTVSTTGPTRTFELRGTTTYAGSGCERNGARPSAAMNVRIWGSCEGGPVNVEITKPSGVYATATYAGDVTTSCGNILPANVKTNLNAH